MRGNVLGGESGYGYVRKEISDIFCEARDKECGNDAAIIKMCVSGHVVTIDRPSYGCGGYSGASLSDRAGICRFSESSARRLSRYCRECVATYTTMVTLTYPSGYGMDGRRCKRDLRVFLQRVRRELKKQKQWSERDSNLWFLEFQRRGAIHYHILATWNLPKEWISRNWYEIVGSEDVRHLKAGTRIESVRAGRAGIGAYVRKYAAKSQQKSVPEDFGWVGRFWGVVGMRSTVSADIVITRKMMENKEIVECFSSILTLIRESMVQGKAITAISGLYRPTFIAFRGGAELMVGKYMTMIRLIAIREGLISETIGCMEWRLGSDLHYLESKIDWDENLDGLL